MKEITSSSFIKHIQGGATSAQDVQTLLGLIRLINPDLPAVDTGVINGLLSLLPNNGTAVPAPVPAPVPSTTPAKQGKKAK